MELMCYYKGQSVLSRRLQLENEKKEIVACAIEHKYIVHSPCPYSDQSFSACTFTYSLAWVCELRTILNCPYDIKVKNEMFFSNVRFENVS
jgi:hypothetical protein